MILRMKLVRCCLGAGALLLVGCFETGEDSEDPPASSGAASDTGAGPTCDPETFATDCVEGDIVECSEDGFVQTMSCGPRSRCEIGSDGPGCVWRIGEACEGEYEQCSDPGGILSCDDGLWRFEGCPVGGACSDEQCFGPEETPCDRAEDEPYCEGEALVECYPHGFEVRTPCGADEVCQLGTMGGVCVATDAVPCDLETFVSNCNEADELTGCGADGWTYTSTCPEGDRCFDGPVGATCHDEDTPACDPETATATCEDGIASFCNPSGYEAQTACDAESACFIDETCLFGCQDLAVCVPQDAELCDEPLDLFCIGEAIAICFAGQVLLWAECGCVEDDDGAYCPEDA